MTTDGASPDNVSDTELDEKVRHILDESINPALQSHGGFARLVKVENRNVHLELGGGCKGCPGARMTMKQGIEAFLRESLPSMGQVIDVTNHGE
jgi:Fe/S biogenesis protein NfuA